MRADAREGDDGDVLPQLGLSDATRDLRAVQIRKHEVLQDEVGASALDLCEGGASVGSFHYPVTLRLQRHAEHLAGEWIVFDDENGRYVAHTSPRVLLAGLRLVFHIRCELPDEGRDIHG